MPAVSVILPTYNRAGFLSSCLNSVFNQTYVDFEIIVIDDGSTDDTRQVLEPHLNRIVYRYQNHKNCAAARNAGLHLAKGRYIALIDSDDIWTPDHLEKAVKFLEADKDAGMIYGRVDVIDKNEQILKNETQKLNQYYSVSSHNMYLKILTGLAIFSSTVVFRKECLVNVGEYDETFEIREDFDWYLRFAMHYGIKFLDGPSSAKYYLREPKLSKSISDRMAQIYIASYEKHLQLLRNHPELNNKLIRSTILIQKAFFYLMINQKRLASDNALAAAREHMAQLLNYRLLKILLLSKFN